MPVAPTKAQFNTTVINTNAKTLFFGFLPPHGKTLTSGQSFTFVGDLYNYCASRGRRFTTALTNAITRGDMVVQTGPSGSETVLCSVLNTTVIAVGDTVFLDTGGDVKSATVFTWDTNIGTTQPEFKVKFLGVALAAHANGGGAIATFPVDISPDVVWQFPCTSEAHEIGDTLGLAKASGNALLPQQLVKAIAANSIARCVSRDASAATTVSVRLQSAYRGNNSGGNQ